MLGQSVVIKHHVHVHVDASILIIFSPIIIQSGGGGTAENAKAQSMYTVVELKSIEDLKREQQVARFASGAPSPATDAAVS